MLALLKLIPLKDWFYAALLIAAGILCFHFYKDGEAKVAAADTKVAIAAIVRDQAITAAAQAKSTSIGVIYEKAVVVPPVADLGIVCHAPISRPVPEATVSTGSPPSPAPVIGSSPAFDPTGPALTIGRDDDALIAALQAEIQALLNAMSGNTK
jgi:hypothetical protein